MVLLALVCAAIPAAAADSPADLFPADHARIARRFAEVLSAEHLSRHPLDAGISAKALENYLRAMDPDRTCFLKGDVTRLRQSGDVLHTQLMAGDLTFARDAYLLWRQRLTNRLAYAEHLLDGTIDLTVDEVYSLRPTDSWAASPAAWDAVWRKKTKNWLLGEVVTLTLAGCQSPRVTAGASVRAHLADRRARVLKENPERMMARYLTAFANAYDADSEYVSPSLLVEGDADREPTAAEPGTTVWSIEQRTDGAGSARSLGVMRLSEFYAGASRDMARVLAHMTRRCIEGVVLDLRGNAGGCQPETVAVTGLFLPAGPVVLTRTRKQKRVTVHADRDTRTAYAGPLVVLVDRTSASAAEVLAGTLQDYGRAIVVGDSRTYGKGRCQTLHRLDAAGRLGAVRMTTMVNYRVSGISAQGQGVCADIVVPSVYEFCLAFGVPGADTETEPPVPAADFTCLGDLARVTASLRGRSLDRRAHNADYAVYAGRLERLAALVRNHAVPLQIEKRLALVRDVGALGGLRELAVPLVTPAASSAASETDVVLNESLAILCDWVALAASGRHTTD